MAKDKLTDYDSTAGGNLDVGGISVAEGMLPSGVNNAIRELMSHQADAFGAGTPLYVDQTNNRLGINQAAPAHPLHVGTDDLIVDASGNLLVGTTSVGGTAPSFTYKADDGYIWVRSSATPVAYFDRNSSDGDIAVFRKDGTTVGSIGTYSSRMYIGTGDVGLQFLDAADNILPINPSTPANRDGAIDLGAGTVRFKDLYLSGGVYLGGTGSANHLDDYEEGTFSLTEVAGSITGDTSRSGGYVKIGRMVMIDFTISGSALTISSYVGFSGLPFTPLDPAAGYTSTEDIDLANGVEATVGTNGILYLSGGGGVDVSRFSGSMVYRTA